MGRKSKYSKALEEKICGLIIEGNTILSICESVNIDEKTFYNWINKNSSFSSAVKKAQETMNFNFKFLATYSIKTAMINGVWQAGAWWLERKFSSEFKNVQEQINTYDVESAREKLTKILDNNEPKRASSS